MESNLFPMKYRIRNTDELVEIVAWETIEKGARNENDWVSYIDAQGNEHIKEHLTLEWHFVVDSPFDSMLKTFEPTKLPEFNPWEARRYELVKEMYFDERYAGIEPSSLVNIADNIISALKKSPEAIEE